MGILERSESRQGATVRVLAVHTSEGIDKPAVDDAAALRDASWWTGSSHAIADNDPGSLLTPAEGCVPYDRAAWTLRSGNRWSENIELVAQAGWSRAQWLAAPTLLDNCARWLAARSAARGIPLVKLTPAQYRAGQWGVIGHNDHTIGYSDGGGTHWDPGPGFPWDVVIDKARAYAAGGNPLEDDMSAAAEEAIFDMQRRLIGNETEENKAKRVSEAVYDVQRVLHTIQKDFGWALGVLMKREDVDEDRVAQMVLDGIKADVTTAAMAGQAAGQALDLSGLGDIVEQRLRAVFGDAAKSA